MYYKSVMPEEQQVLLSGKISALPKAAFTSYGTKQIGVARLAA
jgi:hypothetical protein